MSEAAPACKPEPTGPAPRAGPLLLLDPATPSGVALRTTLAGVLAMALAFALHVEVPALAVVFVLARGNAGAVTMLLGALVGTAAAIALVALFDQHSVACSLALFVLTALATYASLGRRFPYAYIQALLSFLILVGQGLDTPARTVEHAFYDLADVGIAALAAFVVGASQPVRVAGQLQDTLVATLNACAAVLDDAGGRTGHAVLRLELLLRRLHVLLAASWPTRLTSRARRAALAAGVRSTTDLVRAVLALDGLARATTASPSGAGAAAVLHVAAALRIATIDVAPLLAARRGPVASDRATERATARARAAALRIPSLSGGVEPLLAALDASARRSLARLAVLAPDLPPGRGVAVAASTQEPRAPIVPALLDRYRLRHAVKSAASYLIVLWCWVAAHWGAIVPALVVSVLVATLATPLGATLTKATLRIGGVLVGGIAGLLVAVLLLPFITSLPAICVVTGLTLLAFLWVQQHSERLAFAGLQAAIAFVLTLVHGTGPSATWREPLESLLGLAFGISVVVAVMHAVWPLDATTSAHDALAELLATTGRRLAVLLASTRPAAGARDGREVALARLAREHAAGFTHEVEIYGPQFGRPREHLRELLRLTIELEALRSVLEERLRPAAAALPEAPSSDRAALASVLDRACRMLAADLAAPPGEPMPAAIAPVMAELGACAQRLAASGAPAAPNRALWAQGAGSVTALLDRLRDQLASPAHRERRRRVA